MGPGETVSVFVQIYDVDELDALSSHKRLLRCSATLAGANRLAASGTMAMRRLRASHLIPGESAHEPGCVLAFRYLRPRSGKLSRINCALTLSPLLACRGTLRCHTQLVRQAKRPQQLMAVILPARDIGIL